MPDFQRAKIYRLTCDDPELFYYGASCQKYLSTRLGKHKYDWANGGQYTSNLLFDAGGVKIELVENFPCDNKDELNIRERYFIENNPCVNRQHPGRTNEEWHRLHKDRRLDRLRKRVNCDECGEEMNRSSLRRHKIRHH